MFEMCKKLIKIGLTDNLMAKLNAFMAMSQITPEEYMELVELLNAAQGEK